MNLTKVLMTVQILLLISCASKQTNSQSLSSQNQQAVEVLKPSSGIKAPDIGINPEQAFFPLRRDPYDNVIKPSYQSKVCVKKFIVCLKYEKRTLFFNDTEWFYQNGFGLMAMPGLK